MHTDNVKEILIKLQQLNYEKFDTERDELLVLFHNSCSPADDIDIQKELYDLRDEFITREIATMKSIALDYAADEIATALSLRRDL